MSRQEWYRHRHKHLEQPIAHGLYYSFVVFFCSVYANMQHNTLRPEVYVSSAFAYNLLYGAWIVATGTLVQVYVVMWIGLTHDSPLHLAYAGELVAGRGLVCVWFLCVCLIYSATWNFTQVTEQVFTLGGRDRLEVRMRFTAVVMALTVWWQTRSLLPLLGVLMLVVNAAVWAMAQIVY